jgi:hypothetical protein
MVEGSREETVSVNLDFRGFGAAKVNAIARTTRRRAIRSPEECDIILAHSTANDGLSQWESRPSEAYCGRRHRDRKLIRGLKSLLGLFAAD